jgi:hypothetical protein
LKIEFYVTLYHRLDEECHNLKDQLLAERQKWEDLIEVRKDEEINEKRKMMEEREADKV